MIKKKPIVTARYDMTAAFEEEVACFLENIEDHADLFVGIDNDKIRILAEKHLPDEPEEFNRWILKWKLDIELKEYAEKVTADWDYGVDEYECCLAGIDRWLHNVKGPFIAVGINHGWRHLKGFLLLEKDINSSDLWEKIVPETDDLSFYMKGYTEYAEIKTCYHDSPSGEITCIRPIEKYIKSPLSYQDMLKIISKNKQELIYWKAYPDKFNSKSVLEAICCAIQQSMIPWEWPQEWFHKERA